MRPPAPNDSLLRSRAILLAIAAGALAGALLGATAVYLFSAASTVDAPGGRPSVAALSLELRELRAELAQLREQHIRAEAAGFAAVSPDSQNTVNAADLLTAGDEALAVEIEEGLTGQFNMRAGLPQQRRFADPDYNKAMERLMAAGFTAYDAERIFAIEAEAHIRFVDSLRNPGSGERETARQIIADMSESLQDYLGDYGFENYLRSRKLPTDVEILHVDDESAGARAGLREGDRVIAYNGNRVFSVQDLQRLVETAGASGTVQLEITRDGQRELMSVDAGKIGIRARPLSPASVFDLHRETATQKPAQAPGQASPSRE